MKTLKEVLFEQIEDIENMTKACKVRFQYRTEKQQEKAFKTLQQIQEKLYKLLNN